MTRSWKDFLAGTGEDLIDRPNPVQVLVDLADGPADQASLERLTALGLHVEEVAETKVIGTIEGPRLEALREDPLVREVEVASRLRPTGLRH